MERFDTLIVGGGFGGAFAARALERRAPKATILLVAPENFLLFSPLLPEAASGTLEPRHAVAPLRQLLKRTTLRIGTVVDLDPDSKRATIRTGDGDHHEVAFRTAIVAPGSAPMVLPIPGLAEEAVGFKTLADAIWLRNRVLAQLERADAVDDLEYRRELLTFTFVGGGYAGIEALAELRSLALDALTAYPRLRPEDLRWVLVDAGSTLLPSLDHRLGRYIGEWLRERDVEVHLNTRLATCADATVVLEGASTARYRSATVVWTAGQRPTRSGATQRLALDQHGSVLVEPTLEVQGASGVFAVGDVAAVPERRGSRAAATAQHALRQARLAARNVAASLNGRPLRRYGYRTRGVAVTLGRHEGVAQVGPFLLRGWFAWWVGRTYHLWMMPGAARRLRILSDWTLGVLFRRDIAQLGRLGHPNRLEQPGSGTPAGSGAPAVPSPLADARITPIPRRSHA